LDSQNISFFWGGCNGPQTPLFVFGGPISPVHERLSLEPFFAEISEIFFSAFLVTAARSPDLFYFYFSFWFLGFFGLSPRGFLSQPDHENFDFPSLGATF